MGKVRRQRKKFHLEAKTPVQVSLDQKMRLAEVSATPELLIKPQENMFDGLHIDVGSLNKNLSDDVRSVKSFKSAKSDLGTTITKKDKLKMRREILLKKFEMMNQNKLSEKRKKTPVVGDMNPLRDALPSLDSLLKSTANVSYGKQSAQPKKKKGIEKTKKLKKNQLQGVKLFQHIFKNKQYQKDPQTAIAQHVKAMLDNEKRS
jgi:hypothetical protein